MGGFTEGGVKLQSSVAEQMIELEAVAAAGGPYVAAMVAAVAFVAEVVEWMSSDSQTERALRELQEAMQHMAFLLGALDERIDQMVLVEAQESNRNTNRDLKDYLDDVNGVCSELERLVKSPDAAGFVDLTNRAGIIADKFLRDDLDIWRWTDVVVQRYVDPATGMSTEEPVPATKRFKNLPTLPVYILALLTWLAVRERAYTIGAVGQLNGDVVRVQLHRDALTVRPTYRKRGPEEKHPDGTVKWTSTPQSIPENIKCRIISTINASTRYPRNGVCEYWFDLQNHMSGEEKVAGGFDLPAVDPNALCMVDPLTVAPPNAELDAEDAAGLSAIEGLRSVLDRVAKTNSTQKPLVGRFPNWTSSKACYYAINLPGQLLWFEHLWKSDAPGVPAGLSGPRIVANGWDGYQRILPAGGQAIYAIAADGTLLWFKDEGGYGGEGDLSAPVEVGQGWDLYANVVSGGNGVLYTIDSDGVMSWHRHDGFKTGDPNAWQGPKKIGSGWNGVRSVFCLANDGVVYAIQPDGTLVWRRHLGAKDGSPTWAGPIEVGTGWDRFEFVFGTDDGVIYARSSDGVLQWYRHESWQEGEGIPYVTVGGRRVPAARGPVPLWDGPIDIGDDHSRYRCMFGLLPQPLRPPH